MVLFRGRDDVTDPDVSAAMHELEVLGRAPGVMAWVVELSLDTRKGRVIVEDATFFDRHAFDDWRDSESHQRVAEYMARIADWLVGDWQLVDG